jgi:uncharacterized protein (DUF1501 family)
LPATFQGSVFKNGKMPVADTQRAEASESLQRRKLDLMRSLDQRLLAQQGKNDQLESAIANYELAYQMQAAIPDLMDLNGESRSTWDAYGLNSTFNGTQLFGRQCLVARRLIERGVRFVEVLCPNLGFDRWDQHGSLTKGHAANALAVDQPIGALLGDLKERGLLDDTLVIWGGEFGRTPMAQGNDGRDHNPFGFTMWMAGGGARPGTIYGATDDYGYYAVENKVEVHDLHATILHLLGIDHTRLTMRFGGRDMRLTDVHGVVQKGLLA